MFNDWQFLAAVGSAASVTIVERSGYISPTYAVFPTSTVYMALTGSGQFQNHTVQVSTHGTSSAHDDVVYLRGNATSTTTMTGYGASFYNNVGAYNLSITRVVNGSATTLASYSSPNTSGYFSGYAGNFSVYDDDVGVRLFLGLSGVHPTGGGDPISLVPLVAYDMSPNRITGAGFFWYNAPSVSRLSSLDDVQISTLS